ncbi:DUF7373 family lipoprotein [Nocardia sp. IBHARD005]|uniref:DUF7373 family lipoprotein n=1 Tax=Nocardia sp. IBHARD005 TaxID=3457765 RepID=UPI0040591270
MRLDLRLCAALIAMVIVTTGCGSDSQSDTPTVDLSQLDTGNYQSTPRDPNTSKADDTGLAIEAVRLGAAVPLPYDVDRSYGFQRLSSPVVRMTSKIPGTMTRIDDEVFPELTKGLIVGWETMGERRIQPFLGRQAWIYVYRFGTAAEAATAAQRIPEKQQERGAGIAVEIPGFPKARSNWARTALDSWMAQDTMVFGVRLDDPMTEPADPAAAIEFTNKAYTKIIEMLQGYSPTPADKIAALPIDTDGMLSRTLPSDKNYWVGNLPVGAVEPAQAALAYDNTPGTTKPAFIDAGVDLVSSDSPYFRVYRAKDSKATERLQAALLAPHLDDLKPVDSPRNLPNAACYDRKEDLKKTGVKATCYVAFDRYLARISGFNIQEVRQQTSAQYKMLAADR